MASKRAGLHKVMRRHFLESLGIRDGHGWTCYYCRQTLQDYGENDYPNSPAIEHRVPISRGGSDEMHNLRLACKDCNTKKGTRTDDEFLGYKSLEPRANKQLSELSMELDLERKVEIYHAAKRLKELMFPRVTAQEPISERTAIMRTNRIKKMDW